jgi:hypothetical protein
MHLISGDAGFFPECPMQEHPAGADLAGDLIPLGKFLRIVVSSYGIFRSIQVFLSLHLQYLFCQQLSLIFSQNHH